MLGKVHVKKDHSQTYRWLDKWYVYCDNCDMNDHAVASDRQNVVVVRFRKFKDALAAALNHVVAHQTSKISYGRYVDI